MSKKINTTSIGLFIVTGTFHGALAVTAFLRMKIRPVRDARGRVRFRAMNSEKGISPGTVALDPRTEEVAEPQAPVTPAPRPAASTAVTDVEILVPDPIAPVVVIAEDKKPEGDGAEEPSSVETPPPAAPDKKD